MGDIWDVIISLILALVLLCALTVPFAIQYFVRDMIIEEDEEVEDEIH